LYNQRDRHSRSAQRQPNEACADFARCGGARLGVPPAPAAAEGHWSEPELADDTGLTIGGGRYPMSAAFSPIIRLAAMVLADGSSGMTDASATRRRSIPCTRNSGLTTACALATGPIEQPPTT